MVDYGRCLGGPTKANNIAKYIGELSGYGAREERPLGIQGGFERRDESQEKRGCKGHNSRKRMVIAGWFGLVLPGLFFHIVHQGVLPQSLFSFS